MMVEKARAAVGTAGTGLVACDEQRVVVLSLGEGLGPHTRPGALLALMLRAPAVPAVPAACVTKIAGPGEWTIVLVRGRGRATSRERDAAQRLVLSAKLVGVSMPRVVLAAGTGAGEVLAEGLDVCDIDDLGECLCHD